MPKRMALGARRAAGDVDVDREDPVDAAGAGVSLPDDASGAGAGSHGDHEARLGDGLECAADGGLQVARDRAGDHDPVRVARGSAEAANVVPRVQEGGELPVAGVAGARVEVAEVKRSAEHPVDLGRGAGGLGVRVTGRCRRWDGRVVGHDLDRKLVAGARRELEVPSDGNRAVPWNLGTASAENAPREIEGDVAT
jgi:hypothetical protein